MIQENQALFAKYKKSLPIYIEYLSDFETGLSQPEAKALFVKFSGSREQLKNSADKLSLDVINNLLAAAAGEYTKLIDIEKTYRVSYLEQ